jgi:hypothetical protein
VHLISGTFPAGLMFNPILKQQNISPKGKTAKNNQTLTALSPALKELSDQRIRYMSGLELLQAMEDYNGGISWSNAEVGRFACATLLTELPQLMLQMSNCYA